MQGWNDWSEAGAKLASQSSCAGETVPMLGASGVVRRSRLAATKRKCRLGEAWAAFVRRATECARYQAATAALSISSAKRPYFLA
jgi:hypothetical protein